MAESQTDKSNGHAPLLRLSTLTEHRHVVIDGKRYRLRSATQLSAAAYFELQEYAPRLTAIGQRISERKATDDEKLELSDLIDRICRAVLEAPETVQAKLGDNHRLQIAFAFIGSSRTDRRPTSQTRQAAKPQSTGATSRRGSNASTVETRNGG